MAISRQKYVFDAAGTYYIDLWRSLSITERKMFRQMNVARIHGGLILDGDDASTVKFNVAPDNWMIRSAIKRGFSTWTKMNKQAMEGLVGTSVRPKYHDFKVKLNQEMTDIAAVSGSPNVLLPCDAMGNPIAHGEWVYSRYHSEDVDWSNTDLTTSANRDADSFGIMIVGKHVPGTGAGTGDIWSQISLAQSWIDTRALPALDGTSPDFVPEMSADPLANLFDEVDTMDEVLEDLESSNNQPPYDLDAFLGNQHQFGSLPSGWPWASTVASQNLQTVAMAATQSGAGSISAVNSFSAICGLVQVVIEHDAAGNNQVELYLDIDTRGSKV